MNQEVKVKKVKFSEGDFNLIKSGKHACPNFIPAPVGSKIIAVNRVTDEELPAIVTQDCPWAVKRLDIA